MGKCPARANYKTESTGELDGIDAPTYIRIILICQCSFCRYSARHFLFNDLEKGFEGEWCLNMTSSQ
jgi:hypothetical protein